MKRKKKQLKKNVLFIGFFLILIVILFIMMQKTNYSKIEKIFHDIGVGIESIFIPKSKKYSQNSKCVRR